jgi:hypothetical protein
MACGAALFWTKIMSSKLMLPCIAAAFPLREHVYCWCYSFLFGAASLFWKESGLQLLIWSCGLRKSRVRFLVQCCRLALERTHVGQYGNYGYLFWREDVGRCCPFLMVLLQVTCVYFWSFLCCTNWILIGKNYALLPT